MSEPASVHSFSGTSTSATTSYMDSLISTPNEAIFNYSVVSSVGESSRIFTTDKNGHVVSISQEYSLGARRVRDLNYVAHQEHYDTITINRLDD